MKRLASIIFGLCILLTLNAQNPQREFASFSHTKNTFTIHVNDGVYQILFYSADIVETAFIPRGESYIDTSHAVILEVGNFAKHHKETHTEIEIASEKLRVKIQKSPFQISYYDQNGLLISENDGYRRDSLETLEFNLEEEEILYGGGARALGMNRRGQLLKLYNQAHYGYGSESSLMNYCIPIVLSSKRYMLHFDNPSTGFLDLDSKNDNSLSYLASSGRKTYQLIVGDNWEDMIGNYVALTGYQPMPPRWALGNFSSRFGYHSQEEVMHTIKLFENEEIPVDAIILDLYWFGKEIKGSLGNLEFYKDSFPQPKQMMRTLQEKNIQTILITEPFILTSCNRWEEAVDKGILATNAEGKAYTFDFYFGNGGIIDVYSEKGSRWFKDIYLDLFEMGMNGIWGDLGEPEVHPADIIHANGTGSEIRNIYGHGWAALAADAYKEYNTNIRPFILMRAGYSGSQRFGIIPWSGDVNRGWDGLQSQVEIALQMGMQGLAYMHSDLGGFANPNLDDELYVRWLQYGVFQPIFRPHAQEEVPSEPVYRSEHAKKLAKKAIELRYRLLPYNYDLVFRNHTEGKALMRPLFFEEPNNEKLYHCKDAYMWGNNFLVAPVTEAGQKTREIYLPRSADWYDFNTGEIYHGGETIQYQLNEDYIPVFVKAGSLIPMTSNIRNTSEYDGTNLILHYFPLKKNNSGEFSIYNDDGLTANSYKKGKYEMINISISQKGKKLYFDISEKTGKNWKQKARNIKIVVHGEKYRIINQQ